MKISLTRDDLINSLFEIKDDLEKNLKPRLIIIDSLPAIVFAYSDPSKNNGFLTHLANIMRYIAVQHHVTFLITNLITRWNQGDFKDRLGEAEKISCGQFWSSVPNTRIKIEKIDSLCNFSILFSDTIDNTDASALASISRKGFL